MTDEEENRKGINVRTRLETSQMCENYCNY